MHLADLSFLPICSTQGRAALTQEKEEFAHEHKEMKNLEAIVQDIKPTALIGELGLLPSPVNPVPTPRGPDLFPYT